MISRSGFGWNDSTNMIVVEDSIWDNCIKVDPNARIMRFKLFPFYPSCSDDYVPSGFDTNFQVFGEEEEFMSICQPEGSAMKSASTSKKRKSKKTSNDDKFFDMMHSFCDRTKSRLGEIAKRIGYEYDASEARKAVQKIWVEKQLVNNGKDMDLFFSLPNDARAEMVRMMLSEAF
ncbi:hypothetical protein CDL12_02195 [Handroanthus impetiginosus]|uniref:Myb/SANT-like domain-containing protein n=1 Tax=Handroanthus impetiginosus TaxID=429701 RepID=A0A2G9I604_9LAMI|nr:hypothetical protein CDL12_02195 [Handroanthus impetiginosus]